MPCIVMILDFKSNGSVTATKRIEYIRVEFKQSIGMNFVSLFQPENSANLN